MRRRMALQAGIGSVGSMLVSGCIGQLNATPTEPEPLDAEPETLLATTELVANQLPGEWTRKDDQTNNHALTHHADAFREFWRTSLDQTGEQAGLAVSGAWIYDEVESASEFYQDHQYHTEPDFESVDIATEAIAGDLGSREPIICVLFRDTNALGAVKFRYLEEDVQTGIDFAEAVRDTWR